MIRIRTEVPAPEFNQYLDVAWSLWLPEHGKICEGRGPYGTIMEWLHVFGRSAAEAVQDQDLPHAVFGKVIHHYDGRIEEIRMFANTFVTDEDLAAIDECSLLDYYYVAHKI